MSGASFAAAMHEAGRLLNTSAAASLFDRCSQSFDGEHLPMIAPTQSVNRDCYEYFVIECAHCGLSTRIAIPEVIDWSQTPS